MIKKALFALLATSAVVGCTKDEGSGSYDSSNNIATFSSQSIDTRTNDAGTSWEAGDQIGIFSDGFDTDYENVAYKALSSANKTDFTLADDEDPILYPNVAESASKTVDFYAYYPHSESVGSDGLVTIDISEQGDLGAIDFMTASSMDNSYYLGKDYEDVEFEFVHKLSQIVLKISVNDNITYLKGLTARIEGIETQGKYYTNGSNQGTLESSITATDEVALTVDDDLDTAVTTTITAILHPGTYSSAKLIFTLDEADVEYSVTFATTLTASCAHTFNIALGNDITGFTDGSEISGWGSGDGGNLYPTPPDIVLNDTTYEIYSGQGLKAFADLVNGVENTTAVTSGGITFSTTTKLDINGKLMNNVDLSSVCYYSEVASSNWTPIGNYISDTENSTHKYSGDFDGNGKEVRNIYINSENSNYQGLFGYVDGAKISDLGVIGGSVNGNYYTGGVVGYAYSSEITECYNTSDVAGSHNVGGVVGSADSSTVSGCYNTGGVTKGSNIGGVVGTTSGSTVSDCYNTGDVTGVGNIGGVVGYAVTSSKVTSCYSCGAVSGSSYRVGGVVGNALTSSTVTSCYSCGTVSGSSVCTDVGGVAGQVDNATISYCYYDTGTVGTTYNPSTAVGNNTTSGGTPDSTNVATGYAGLSTTQMTDGTLYDYLQSAFTAEPYPWTNVTNDYPILSWQTSGN